jgi:hypothetical protein
MSHTLFFVGFMRHNRKSRVLHAHSVGIYCLEIRREGPFNGIVPTSVGDFLFVGRLNEFQAHARP